MLKLKNKVAIAASCSVACIKAQELSSKINLPIVDYGAVDYPYLLVVFPGHLELQLRGFRNSKPLFVDFLAKDIAYRVKHGGGCKQLIAKAVGIKSGIRPTILDATAGFGVDAFVLASLGCKVTMLERSLIAGVLLQDGLDRFINSKSSCGLSLSLIICEAIDYLKSIEVEQPDVIYLDPMYPVRKKSGANCNKMRVLHDLVGGDSDIEEVFSFALKVAKKRVVVKRPKSSNYLRSRQPDIEYSFKKSCRFDVYLTKIKKAEHCPPFS